MYPVVDPARNNKRFYNVLCHPLAHNLAKIHPLSRPIFILTTIDFMIPDRIMESLRDPIIISSLKST